MSEKSKTIEEIRRRNPVLWDEIAEYMALLKKWGITGYKLTGPVENPIITTWKITTSSQGLDRHSGRQNERGGESSW